MTWFPLGPRRRRAGQGPRLVKVPKGSIRRAATRRMQVRTRPQVKAVRMKGQAKCGICLGVIKEDLPSVLCACEGQFHNSCAVRTGECPVCGRRLGYKRQKPHVVDSDMPPVRPRSLSKTDKLFLLEERFLLGEVSERTYLAIRSEVNSAPDDARFCDTCGRRLLDGESCDCILYEREFQCPECGSNLSEDERFCHVCGVVFSPDFSDDLFQCPECGRIVSGDESSCRCGVMLVGEGNMICPECGAEIPRTAQECEVCGRSFAEEISECPACGRRVDRDAVVCECGVVFSDMVAGIECSECGAGVDLNDIFCPECGARFADELALEGRQERNIRG